MSSVSRVLVFTCPLVFWIDEAPFVIFWTSLTISLYTATVTDNACVYISITCVCAHTLFLGVCMCVYNQRQIFSPVYSCLSNNFVFFSSVVPSPFFFCLFLYPSVDIVTARCVASRCDRCEQAIWEHFTWAHSRPLSLTPSVEHQPLGLSFPLLLTERSLSSRQHLASLSFSLFFLSFSLSLFVFLSFSVFVSFSLFLLIP